MHYWKHLMYPHLSLGLQYCGWMSKITNAEDIEAEALADGLVDKLVWEAIEAHVARQVQGPHSIVL